MMRLKKRELHMFVVGVLVGVLLFSLQKNNQHNAPAVAPKTEDSIVASTAGTTISESRTYEVVKVVDGDTIQVKIEDKKQSVRLIGVDAPESVDPRRPVQCFGDKASQYLKEILLHKQVILESDPTQGDSDKYKRLLRYVILEDGTNINKQILEQGYGHQYTYNKPYKYRDEFVEAEQQARDNKRGLWADDACVN